VARQLKQLVVYKEASCPLEISLLGVAETTMPLTPYVEDQIWLRTYPVRLAGTRFDARMTVICLASGQLMLHSPCHITPAIAKEISALGQVAHT
jgi:hypothetical protein